MIHNITGFDYCWVHEIYHNGVCSKCGLKQLLHFKNCVQCSTILRGK